MSVLCLAGPGIGWHRGHEKGEPNEETRKVQRRETAVMLGAALVLMAAAAPASAPPAKPVHSLKIVREYPMPMNAAADVRWAGEDSILVSDLVRGVGEVTLPASGKATVAWLPEWPPPTGPGTQVKHLALSGDRIAAADTPFLLRWHARHGKESGQMAMEYIADIDLFGDRLLVSGLRFDAAGKLGMDGAMAWIGSLSLGEEGLKPILPFRDQDAIMRCFGMGLGVVRFLSDGSFVIVPGAEPDIFLYGRDGRLRHTWRTEALGVAAPCAAITKEQQKMLWTNPEARQELVNRHAMIDEVIDTPDGPAVVIRTRGKRTTWEIVVLNGDAGVRFTLPFSSGSPWAHVSADTRGLRSVFLIVDRTAGRDGGPTPRLILTEWSEH